MSLKTDTSTFPPPGSGVKSFKDALEDPAIQALIDVRMGTGQTREEAVGYVSDLYHGKRTQELDL